MQRPSKDDEQNQDSGYCRGGCGGCGGGCGGGGCGCGGGGGDGGGGDKKVVQC